MTTPVAQRVVDSKGNRGDMNSLFWLRLQSCVLEKVAVGRALLAVCEARGVAHSKRVDAFFGEARSAVMEDGEVNIQHVDPTLHVVAMGKASAWEEYGRLMERRGLTGVCLQPFAFQTANERNFKGSLFFIFAHWQDALHAILRIVSEGLYRAR